MNRPPTLADVAARAGVSAKTVSNVLRDLPHVAEETRERVRAAAEEVGYRPHPAGRGLASGRTGRIAVVVPNLFQAYFAELAELVIVKAEVAGLTTTLRLAPGADAELRAILGASTSDADAVVICPHHHASELLGDDRPVRPVIQVGGSATPGLDCVIMGEYDGALAVTRHVLETGRRRVALVWNTPNPGGERFQGILDALAERGLVLEGSMIAVGSDWDRPDSGYEAMVGLLRAGERPDVVVCVNDAVAVGALRALRSAGLRVPADVVVSGFDDIDESEFTTPPLTSVDPDQDAMAEAGVRMLLERLAGHDGPARHVRTGARVVVRASTRP